MASLASGTPARAETTIPSRLDCSALSINPDGRTQFSQTMNFFFDGQVLRAERFVTRERPGKEVFVGALGPNRTIRVTGQGAYADRGTFWHYELAGAFRDGTFTELNGPLVGSAGGRRNCRITFLLPPEQLAAVLFPPVAPHIDQSGIQANAGRPQAPGPDMNASSPQPATSSQPAGTIAQQAPSFGRRVALVVGNSDYKSVPALLNPQRDATMVAKTLKDVGFQSVTLRLNLERDQLLDALKEFAKQAENADWALVYYAGHGIEAAGTNYLIPTDAKLTSDRDVGLEAIPIHQVLNAAERAHALRLVILDACRDNPFVNQMKRTETVASRSVGHGLARVEPDAGTLVVFAAKHGETALDGNGNNSPFASAFVKDLQVPGVEVRRLFDNVRDDVMEITGRQQQPYSYGSVPGRQDFYFVSK
jgi:hypothetical protein